MKFLKFAIDLVKSFGKRWLDMFLEGTSRMAESIFAMILILWGMYLLSPGWARRTDIYKDVYQRISADLVTGGVMLGVGLAFMTAILWQWTTWRSRGCILAGCVFAGLWWIYWVAGRASVGLVILPFFMFSCVLLYLRPHLITYFRNRLLDAAEREINGKHGRHIGGSSSGYNAWGSHKIL